jgi:hypothetical protein
MWEERSGKWPVPQLFPDPDITAPNHERLMLWLIGRIAARNKVTHV